MTGTLMAFFDFLVATGVGISVASASSSSSSRGKLPGRPDFLATRGGDSNSSSSSTTSSFCLPLSFLLFFFSVEVDISGSGSGSASTAGGGGKGSGSNDSNAFSLSAILPPTAFLLFIDLAALVNDEVSFTSVLPHSKVVVSSGTLLISADFDFDLLDTLGPPLAAPHYFELAQTLF